MSREHVGHSGIVRFAQDRVNLPKDTVNVHRAQARRLREKLDSYVREHPDFTLRKMLLSGSLSKGTALSTLNDIDVACYIAGVGDASDAASLLSYLSQRLQRAFPNFRSEQVKPLTYSLTVSFRESGLNVDVVPILYSGAADWRGWLVSQDDGSLLETSIPLHRQFIQRRKDAIPVDFAQVVRLAKWWVRQVKRQREDFRFKSFMVELVLAYLADQGVDFADYPEAMQAFFTFISKTGLRQRIVFEDNYSRRSVGVFSDVVQIIDPVNPKNNVGRLYTEKQADAIVEEALDAGDSIDAALRAPTKRETIYYWQRVFGPSFQG